MKKLSLKNSESLTVDEAFADFKGRCRIKNLSEETIRLYQHQFRENFEKGVTMVYHSPI